MQNSSNLCLQELHEYIPVTDLAEHYFLVVYDCMKKACDGPYTVFFYWFPPHPTLKFVWVIGADFGSMHKAQNL